MIFKATWFYRQADHGWSETLYRDSTDYDEMAVAAQAYLARRIKLMPGDCSCRAIRISKPGAPQDSFLFRPVTTAGGIPKGVWPVDPSTEVVHQATDALNITLIASFEIKGRIFLRGIPSGQIVGGDFVPDAGYTALLLDPVDSLQHQLNSDHWAFRHKNQTPPPIGFAYSTVVSIIFAGVTTRATGRPFGLRPGRHRR